MRRTLANTAAIVIVSTALTACAAKDRLSYIGQPPPLSPMDNTAVLTGSVSTAGMTPAQIDAARAQRIQTLMAERDQTRRHANSLWSANTTTFFGDPRASNVGDIVTVKINISDRAQVQNQTSRARQTSERSNLTNFLGGEAALDGFFNDAVDPANLTRFGSNSSMQGTGSVNRSESITMTAAAIVVDVLWNGNLVIHGRQEVRINNEVRELLLSGIVRPQDIAADNSIDHRKIAEARVSYGGRGHISEMQRPPIGQEVYNLLWPF
ncbi:flagellar basal body L-ring protein FlgH [Alkalicaulis satelles]|uniref:Flagellar L-ring protein n=1 Tax=Alkalicaulis satelles TaxID=2609175 RepID=A0A5M6ZJC2_9PROT|nr:flagellar basal body L-ring protein FlgH [Alkalicaulis satelles]KAA5803348.1 flagellar basal body L-ring protein FlgH [Alkalicaulis satelles]